METNKPVRKRRDISPFSIVPANVNTHFTIRNGGVQYQPEYTQTKGIDLPMCPYTNLIPLNYLFIGSAGHIYANYGLSNVSSTLLTEWGHKTGRMGGNILSRLIYLTINTSSVTDASGVKEKLTEIINNYLYHDKLVYPKSPTQYYYRGVQTNAFLGNINGTARWESRNFMAAVGKFMCMLHNPNIQRFETQIIAVIRPEHYLYQKLLYLSTGEIDVTKVIILVNSELGSTSFYNKYFRAAFKRVLEPLLNEIPMVRMNVPRSFIDENCFLQPYKIKKQSLPSYITEDKKMIEHFIADTQSRLSQFKTENAETQALSGPTIANRPSRRGEWAVHEDDVDTENDIITIEHHISEAQEHALAQSIDNWVRNGTTRITLNIDELENPVVYTPYIDQNAQNGATNVITSYTINSVDNISYDV